MRLYPQNGNSRSILKIPAKPPKPKKRLQLVARLRPRKDQDLIEATSSLSRGNLADIVRESLRAYLFGPEN